MKKVEDLRVGWEVAEKAATNRKSKKDKPAEAPDVEEDGLSAEEEADDQAAPSVANLFDDSDDESDTEGATLKEDTAEEKSGEAESKPSEEPVATQEDLFGDDSSDEEESDEELTPSGPKRENEANDDAEAGQPANKKRKVFDDDSE